MKATPTLTLPPRGGGDFFNFPLRGRNRLLLPFYLDGTSLISPLLRGGDGGESEIKE